MQLRGLFKRMTKLNRYSTRNVRETINRSQRLVGYLAPECFDAARPSGARECQHNASKKLVVCSLSFCPS